MFAPAMLFSISGLMVGVSALATTADIVGDLAVYGTPWYVFWTIIQRGSWTVFKRLPLLFAVALPIGLAQKQPARCCLEALVAYFAYCFFLSEIIKLSGDNLGLEYPSSLTSASGITVIDGIKTLDTGIIGPLAVSATVVAIHDRFYDAKIPDWLGTFSGSSLVYLISFFAVFALAAISAAIVPYVYDVTDTLRHALAGVGPFGVGIFVFLERALEPFGLHHLLYMPIYYDNLVINDGIYATWSSLLPILSHSTRPLNELAPWAGFTATGWVKLFGLPAIAAAFYSTAKLERRAGLRVILVPAIIASVVCGVTEPLEFLFMFTYPGLFLLYAVLSSCLAMAMNFFGVVGIFSGGFMEMAAFNYIPLMRTHAGSYLLALGIGLVFSVIFFLSFRGLILTFDLKTPGREDHIASNAALSRLTGDDVDEKRTSKTGASDDQASQDHLLAEQVVTLLGGVSNIVGATNCATRLRVEVVDPSIVADNATFVAAGAKGLIVTGKTAQVIIGISVPRVKKHFDQIMGLEPGFAPIASASPAASAAHKHGDICFFDIDGTLAWQDPRLAQKLPEDERDLSPYPNEAVSQAIREFVANDNMAFICTGRTLSCIHPKLLELPWTGVVCLAGGYAELEGRIVRNAAMSPGLLQRLAPYLEQSDEVIRFEGLDRVVRMSADAPETYGYARTVGDAVTKLKHYSAYKILMSTKLANRIAQDKEIEPLLCFNELELEVTEISPPASAPSEPASRPCLAPWGQTTAPCTASAMRATTSPLWKRSMLASPWATRRTSLRRRRTM